MNTRLGRNEGEKGHPEKESRTGEFFNVFVTYRLDTLYRTQGEYSTLSDAFPKSRGLCCHKLQPSADDPRRLCHHERCHTRYGATGFVGSAVARVLEERGHRLRLLVRPTSDRSNIAELNAELAVGDLSDPDTLAPALKGVKILFHVAADYRLWVPDPETMMKANVEGTRNLMLAALEAGVEKSFTVRRLRPWGCEATACRQTKPRRFPKARSSGSTNFRNTARNRKSSASSGRRTCRRSS